MKKFCTDLRKHATEITNYEKKEILPLTDEEMGTYNNKKFCHICKRSSMMSLIAMMIIMMIAMIKAMMRRIGCQKVSW